jgi:hypothetical protein
MTDLPIIRKAHEDRRRKGHNMVQLADATGWEKEAVDRSSAY